MRPPTRSLASCVLALVLACGGGSSGSNDTDLVDDSGADPQTDGATGSPGDSASDTGPADPTGAATGSVDDGTTGAGPLPAGLPCGTAFDQNGRTGCETVVEGLEVKFFPLPEGQRVRRLAVYLHGDGAADYSDGWAFSPEIFAWTDARDTLVVGVLSPASYDDGTVAFGAAQPEHAELVATTIEAFVAAYEPEFADQTLWWGVSGGSWFFASSFIAVAGPRLPGVYVANCGGSGGSFGWTWDPTTDTATRDMIPIYFNYGTEDFLADNIVGSIAEYEGKGFVVDALVHEGAMHCMHPIDAPTLEFWGRHVP